MFASECLHAKAVLVPCLEALLALRTDVIHFVSEAHFVSVITRGTLLGSKDWHSFGEFQY